jgi:hypothetical protein
MPREIKAAFARNGLFDHMMRFSAGTSNTIRAQRANSPWLRRVSRSDLAPACGDRSSKKKHSHQSANCESKFMYAA